MGNYEKIRLSVSWREGDIDHIEDDDEFDSIWNDVTELKNGLKELFSVAAPLAK